MEKKDHKVKIHSTGKVPQPNTTQRYRTEKIENKQHKAKYLTGKVPQPNTTEWYRTQKMEKKQDKDEYLTGKVPQPKTTEICPAEKMESKQHKDEYLTGKVPQPKTRERYRTVKMENKKHKDEYLTGKDCQQRRSKTKNTRTSITGARFHNRRQKDTYWTEKKTKGKITATLTNAIRVSVSPSKITGQLQIHYLMENLHFMDTMVDSLYSKNVLQNFSIQSPPSRNAMSTASFMVWIIM